MLSQYPPHGVAEAIRAAILRRALQTLLKPAFSPRRSVAFQRRWLKTLSGFNRLPRGAEVVAAEVGGVAGEWVRRSAASGVAAHAAADSAADGVVQGAGQWLYLHGGAYCLGSPRTHRNLSTRLALGSGMPVFMPDYRLAPESRFPAALDDALAVYRAMAAQGPVVVAGDSAGGGLALATALALRDSGQPPPAALVLLSPWADMVLEGEPPTPTKGEAMLSLEWAQACAEHYLGPDTPPSHPWVSPLRADLRGLPPTLIQAGTDEMLHGQAIALHDALAAAGVAVQCQITPRRWHVFQLHAGSLGSADAALARVLGFVEAVLADGPGAAPRSAPAPAPISVTADA